MRSAMENEAIMRANGQRASLFVTEEPVGAKAALSATILLPATHAAMTGMLDRDRFYDVVSKELSRSERCASCGTLVLCQVEQLVGISIETFHDALVRSCSRCLRGYDYAGRLAENTIGLLLPESDRFGAQTAICRMAEDSMAQFSVLHPAQRWELRIGIGGFPFEAETVDALFRTAAETQFLLVACAQQLHITL
jgi:GGDEF domain-containing protein